MGAIYSYFFTTKEEEFEHSLNTDNIHFNYNIYNELPPLTRENLILNDIECAENLKRLYTD